jgi:hypothetical protein
MNLLSEMVERERRADELRQIERQREIDALLGKGRGKEKKKKMRHSLGSKLVEWGEQLQENPAPKASTSKI